MRHHHPLQQSGVCARPWLPLFHATLILAALLLALSATAARAANVVVDHTNYNEYDLANTATITRVGQLRVFFAHASVGGNMVGGLDDLYNGNRYMLDTVSDDATPPDSTTAGTFYEYNRGNPGWSDKISDFETYVDNGWHDTKVDVIMNKFCYIDPDADWDTYRTSMVALESAHPDTAVVYMTIPIKTNTNSSDGWKRQQFNDSLRDWIDTQDNKFLLDIADIEAYSPSGEQQTSTYSGNTYQTLYSGYTSDGGHLNDTGSLVVARGVYTLLANVDGDLTSVPALGGLGLLVMGAGLVGGAAWMRRRGKGQVADC